MSTEIERIRDAEIDDDVQYTEFGDTYLKFREDTPYALWLEVVRRLKSAEKSIQWWIGDALHFGERTYGEMYSQALEETDYAYGTLRNAAWVAGKIEVSRRHDNLSFAHHQAVAPLPPEEQDALLAEAAPQGKDPKPRLSAGKLRERQKPKNTEVITHIVCPACGVISPMNEVETREVQA